MLRLGTRNDPKIILLKLQLTANVTRFAAQAQRFFPAASLWSSTNGPRSIVVAILGRRNMYSVAIKRKCRQAQRVGKLQ